ncbi:MAG: alanine--tRNA ligase [Candidatus Anstonellales archaeon]
MLSKEELRKQFSKNWEKHYKLQILGEKGFKRQKCKKCGKYFWAKEEREVCGDSACMGYQFIGNPSGKKLGYVETWKEIEKYFVKHGHESIKPYPTVARWRDDLYFTIASINLFQPYVVSGEIEPIANPLIVPQTCIRFNDIANVGITGRHYSNFVMIGQHAFNTKKTGLFYWKEEAVGHDLGFMKALGIKEEEIFFHEDVWVGGGNFGPSLEYFVKGLELGNCVFMQYEETPDGKVRELKTKVIDMGAGLARFPWISHGSPTSYEMVLGPARKMRESAGIKIDEKLLLEYAKLSGGLDVEEARDVEAEKDRIARQLGMSKKELFETIGALQVVYATADHLLTLLFTIKDGMLPSNSGGGYNLRMLARRVFAFEEEHGFSWDYYKILEWHAEFLRAIFPELKEGVELTADVVHEEKNKYKNAKQNAGRKVEMLLSAKKTISQNELLTLYESDGIPPELIAEEGEKRGVKVEVPGNFYELLEKQQGKEEEKKMMVDVSRFPKTEILYYQEPQIEEFEAKVLGFVECEGKKAVVLNKTAFYPEGGGQVGDTGFISDAKVIDARKINGVVCHVVENAGGLKKGEKVKCKVDLGRRKQITRNHTAVHLLNAACRKILGSHVWQAGSYKDESIAHLDVTHYRKITEEQMREMEKLVNGYIMANMPITVEVLLRNVAEQKYGMRIYQGGAVPGRELRIVRIGDIDVEACGGTHSMLKTTGEIGFFKIVRREGIKDGVERIILKAGEAAVSHVQEKEKLLHEAASKISVQPEKLPSSVERFFEEWKAQKKEVERLKEKIAQLEVQEFVHESIAKQKVVFVLGEYDVTAMQKMASIFIQHEKAMVVIMNREGNFVVATGKNAKQGAGEIAAKVVEKLGGKGGGKGQIAFGKVNRVERLEF